jgi:chromosome segregation ATPase
MTKAEEVYERITALVEHGASKADAFRALAAEYDQPVKSLQGIFYQHQRKLNGGSRRSPRRETTSATAVERAVTVLEKALGDIDSEIEIAKERAEEAKAEYEALKASATERKQAIQTKIDALGN